MPPRIIVVRREVGFSTSASNDRYGNSTDEKSRSTDMKVGVREFAETGSEGSFRCGDPYHKGNMVTCSLVYTRSSCQREVA